MKNSFKTKLTALFMCMIFLVCSLCRLTVFAAESDNIEVILTDVTADDETTLSGEAKIKVGVKIPSGKLSAVQTALKFTGNLKYKSIDFLIGENNPPECFHISPNAALVNSGKTLLPGIATNINGQLDVSEEIVDLFVITFSGNPGDSVTLSLNEDSKAGTYCAMGNSYIELEDDAQVSLTAKASKEDNVGVEGVVRLVMNLVDDFTVSNGSGYADSKITLSIIDEITGTNYSTVLNTVSNSKGGHYDSSVSIPTFVVKDTFISGHTYSVSLSGNGYVAYEISGVDFENTPEIQVDNSKFIPGDTNSDGKVSSEDKEIFESILSGNVNDYDIGFADFNRDGKVDKYDDIFEGIEFDPNTNKTVPEKMSVPSITGGNEEITLKWTLPNDGGSAVTGYVIKYGTTQNLLSQEKIINTAQQTSYTVSNLSAGTKYYVQIAAVNGIGTGEFSDIASAVTNQKQIDENSGNNGGNGGGNTGGNGGNSGGGFSGGGFSGGAPSVPYIPANPNEPFTDISNYEWAKDSIYALKNAGIISGISATEFAPANNIKRGDFILILTRMLSVNDEFTTNFADVPVSSYYYNAIGSARAAGIAQGSGESFMPENTITRQDLITLAYRAFLAKGYISETDDISSLDAFSDKVSISEYAKAPMAAMVSAGIIKGSEGNVNPLGFATRAEVAVMCARLKALMN